MSDNSFTIKKLTYEDVSSVASIESECFSTPWSEEGIKSEISNPSAEFFVLEENDTACAYMGMYIILDECYIANVAVKKDFRRKGYGLALVENAISVAREKDCSFISLEVRVSNHKAIALYSKCGFESLGVRKNFYSSPVENALIMTKYFK